MKAILIAALALMSAPAMAQDSDAQASLAATKACITENATTLAKGSKESADVLADLVIYRCGNGSIERTAALRVLPARMMALDTIVKARMGV